VHPDQRFALSEHRLRANPESITLVSMAISTGIMDSGSRSFHSLGRNDGVKRSRCRSGISISNRQEFSDLPCASSGGERVTPPPILIVLNPTLDEPSGWQPVTS
jgi:hypothetical protein